MIMSQDVFPAVFISSFFSLTRRPAFFLLPLLNLFVSTACKMIAPLFKELSNDFDNAVFLKVDVDGK